jgi:hypothetical protein
MLETVFALCMFVMPENKLIEHRIQESMESCIGNKLQSLRHLDNDKYDFRCGQVEVEIEYNVDGSKTIGKIIKSK